MEIKKSPRLTQGQSRVAEEGKFADCNSNHNLV